MSHHACFSLAVFHSLDATDTWAQMFAGACAPVDRDGAVQGMPRPKPLHGSSRNGWFQTAIQALLDVAGGLDSLRFLSAQSSTHRAFHCTGPEPFEAQRNPHGEDRLYTLFDAASDMAEAVIEDLDRFIRWSAHHVGIVQKLTGSSEAQVLQALYHAGANSRPNDGNDDGQGVAFLFGALKTVREYLAYAHRHGLCAVYVSEQPQRWTWFCAHSGLDSPQPGVLYPQTPVPMPPRVKGLLQPWPASQWTATQVPSLLMGCEPSVREQAMMRKPAGVDADPDLAPYFEQASLLWACGHVVWGALVQADERLLQPAFEMPGALGVVVYDPQGRMSPQGLEQQAQSLFGLRGNRDDDPRRQALADALMAGTPWLTGYDTSWSGEPYALKVSSLYVDRLHLPDGMLTRLYFPLLVSDDCPGVVAVLPCVFWPRALREAWMRVSIQRFGQPHDPRPTKQPDVPIVPEDIKETPQAKEVPQEATAAQAVSGPALVPASRQPAPPPSQPSKPAKPRLPAGMPDGDALFRLDSAADLSQGVEQALPLWEKAARMRHPESMNNLGVLCANGLGVEQNMPLAFQWFLFAAEKGHSMAQVNLGKLYLRHDSGNTDLFEARHWLEKAAAGGNKDAALLLVEHGLTDEPGARGAPGESWKRWLARWKR